MKKKPLLWIILLLVAGIAAVMLVWGRSALMPDTFNGNRVRNPDSYTLEFTRMNATDSHQLACKAGDSLHVAFDITKGKVDLTIGMAGESSIYVGNSIDTASFEVGIPADGVYQITVDARNAAGFIKVLAK